MALSQPYSLGSATIGADGSEELEADEPPAHNRHYVARIGAVMCELWVAGDVSELGEEVVEVVFS